MKDHLDNPVKKVVVRLVNRQLFGQQQGQEEEMPCPDRSSSSSNGLAIFICNVPKDAVRTVLMVRTFSLHVFPC